MNAISQTDAILRVLKRRKGSYVSLPVLARESGSLSPATRISNLRDRGHRIENRLATVKRNGQPVRTSAYRLLS